MFAKKLVATGIAIVVTLGLTACDPPMPPEILAAQAERTVNCIDGDLKVATPEAIGDVVAGWADSIAGACSGMTLTPVAANDEAAQAVISLDGTVSPACTPFATFPIGVDAGVIAYSVADAQTLNLTPQNIQDIFSGKVTNWSDPSLAATNPDTTLPNEPINVVGTPQKQAVDSLAAWFKKLKVAFTPTLAKVSTTDDGAFLATMAEGDIAITSYSNALFAYSALAAVTIGADPATQSAVADASGVQRGADLKPAAAAEGETPAYAATYPVNMFLCGADNNVARAVGRYLVRQDAQGALGSAVVAPLPDSERLKSITIVEKGLPKAVAK